VHASRGRDPSRQRDGEERQGWLSERGEQGGQEQPASGPDRLVDA
jgi:hypothetical protein